MTLDCYIDLCRKAIRGNFKSRNVRVMANERRHRLVLAQRRQTVRMWIARLRMALDPRTAPEVAATVAWRVA